MAQSGQRRGRPLHGQGSAGARRYSGGVMWSLVERYKQRRARRKFMPEPRRRGTGTITKGAIAALVVVLAASAALQLRGGSSATTAFVKFAQSSKVAPLDVIERASAAH